MKENRNSGYVLVTVLMLSILIVLLLSTYAIVTRSGIQTSKANANSTSGFYAAEGGLNLRAENLRQILQNYSTPTGSGPTSASPCIGTDLGSGDLRCQDTNFGSGTDQHTVKTYVIADPTTTWIKIPPGELYENLNAEERRYDVYGKAVKNGDVEALTYLRTRIRSVPIFQFAVFFDKDLEFTNTAQLDLTGPIYANGDIYLDGKLNTHGQITTSQSIYRGAKESNVCTGPVNIDKADGTALNFPSNNCRYKATDTYLADWNGSMKQNVPKINTPTVDDFLPQDGKLYWDKADMRLRLKLNANGTYNSIQMSNVTYPAWIDLNPVCPSAATYSNAFRDNREEKDKPTANQANKQMLDIDLSTLLNCIKDNPNDVHIPGGVTDTTEGGLVIHLSVDGPNNNVGSPKVNSNYYGVRIKNGSTFPAGTKGLTLVSDQAVYIQGNFNSVNKKPASVLGDIVSVISNNWDNAQPIMDTAASTCGGRACTGLRFLVNNAWVWGTGTAKTGIPANAQLASGDAKSRYPLATRWATDTTVNAAVIDGTDTTGGAEGTAGQNLGGGNGGVHNMLRFQEDWGSNSGLGSPATADFSYTGSLVSLDLPKHSNGSFLRGEPVYEPPHRIWNYDTDFRNIDNLPPLTPRFVYLRQERFVRTFDQ